MGIEKLELENGKYTLILDDKGGFKALRYGEEWRDLTGDKMAYLMFARLQEQQALVGALRSMLAATDSSEPELFVGHHDAYLKTVAIPRAKEALAKAGAA